jgi:hypothetical protein
MPGRPRKSDYPGVENRSMARKLQTRRAVDLSLNPRVGDYYMLDHIIDGMDYCDCEREVWIWSIGRRLSDDVILASTRPDLYQNPHFDCLWLR